MNIIVVIILKLVTSYFLNETELLRHLHYEIRQTVAQSKRLYEYTSGKPKKNSQKAQFLKKLKIDHFG